jgi:hypothetical protein
MRRIHLYLLFVILAITTTACPMRSAIWIIQGSTASHLEFGISNKRNGTEGVQWAGLGVLDCHTRVPHDQHVYWSIERDPTSWSDESPTRVIYGTPPAGFRSLSGPETLRAGCYEAFVGGTGDVEFEIDSAGLVKELPNTR